MLTCPSSGTPARGKKRPAAPPVLSAEHSALLAEAHIGLDEAGRGCLAGPVVAAAVFFLPDFAFAERLPGLNDSKALSEKQRDALAPRIAHAVQAWGIGLSWQDEIDRINILQATFRAMSRAALALDEALRAMPEHAGTGLPRLLIDGSHTLPEGQWRACAAGPPETARKWEQLLDLPPTASGPASGSLLTDLLRFSHVSLPSAPTLLSCEAGTAKGPSVVSATDVALPDQRAIVDGDALAPAISAASVLAKTVRDAIMRRLESAFPGYDLAGHKGYGTRAHLECLSRLGPSPLHRATFKGVRREEEQCRLF